MAERETGIPKDTLRIWERRYGFPRPQRDAQGDRGYDLDQIERLRLIKRLLDAGLRPAKVVGLDLAGLKDLIRSTSPALPETAAAGAQDEVLDALRANDLQALRARLGTRLATAGLLRFVSEHLAPLNTAVGEAWAEGSLTIAQEHLYTEEVARLIRSALQALPQRSRGARVLLATLPGEQHGLGLLMAEAILAVLGATPVNIGTEVPVDEIGKAAHAHGCKAVAVSLSTSRSPTFVRDGMAALRAALDPGIALWAGGRGAQHLSADDPAIRRLDRLEDLVPQLATLDEAGSATT